MLDLTINLVRGNGVTVNNFVYNNFDLQSGYFAPDVVIKKVGIFLILEAEQFMIKWDGATRLYITAKNSLIGKMKGLCGNNDGDSTNDKV